jgi:DNA-binding SARP family transcriptional activator/Flp pilus assembly protein TadD
VSVSRAEVPLAIRLLGGCELTARDGSPLTALLVQPKRLALLLYLAVALPRGLRRRDELLALFWPESDADRARNSLRQALHELRTHLPAGVLITRGTEEVGLRRDLLQVDVHSFEDLLESGREEEGLALYRGDLLPGFHLPACSDFQAWLDAERERLRRRAVRAALVLARRRELDGENAAATEWARFAQARAPFDEGVLREVLELLTDLGDGAEAMRVRDAAAERFRREIGIELSPETQRMGRGSSSVHRRREITTLSRGAGATTNPRRPHRPPLSTAPSPITPDARHLYLRARHASGQRSPNNILDAIDLFQQALRLSPDYAEAHSGLAFALTQAIVYVAYPAIQALPAVKAHALKAIRLDPSLGEAHAMLAQATLWYDYDWRPAEEIYLRALDADPTSDVLCCSYSLYYLTPMGRLDEALAVLDRARDTMPVLLGISTFCGLACAFGRRFDRAKREADSVLTMEPGFVQAYWVKGMALEGLEDFEGAIASFERGVSLTNGSSLMLSQLGRARARAGDRAGAQDILAELDRRGETAGPAAYFTAELLAALGRPEEAVERLYAAYRERNPLLVFAGIMPGLDPLRAERRFGELLLRIGLRARERVA